MKIKNFRMSEFLTCNAQLRPSYCKFATNVCCFPCEYNSECSEYAKANKLMRPCTMSIFDEYEICEYAL